MTTTVLILGAAGRIGQVLATAFADAGWSVRAQSRKALPQALDRGAIRPVRCDALDAAAIRTAASGADVVVHALNPPYADWSRQAGPLADAAMAAAQVSGALLMLPGNVYNFGSKLPPLLTPTTPEHGDHAKARIRIDIEARMAAAPGLDSVVLRAGDFFGGGGRGSWFDLAVAARLRSDRFVYPGPPDVVHAWAYLPDLAQAFVRVAERRARLRGQHRLHFAGHAVTGAQLHEAMEAAMGRPLRRAGMPWGLMRLLSPLVPTWREVVAMRYLWQRPHRLDDSSLRALIGEPPHTPLREAVAQACRDLQQPASGSGALAKG
ncbi:MAG TPA: NAD-dependent epimerase/dehydratase family protein [Albitalea sp.]